MPLHILNEKIWFPPVSEALDDGLLAMGGDLSEQRILFAYKNGIFPWYENNVPLWWCPDPRFVLFPENLKISKSMNQLFRRNEFAFRINTSFKTVMLHCGKVKRKGQSGTWINNDMIAAYSLLHEKGYACSAETWQQNKLAGGLYGIKLGNVFFGESMFNLQPNASKYAFILYVKYLQNLGVKMIDCQVYTPHLESLGATMISRKDFLQILQNEIS